jgi:hypothetical protein
LHYRDATPRIVAAPPRPAQKLNGASSAAVSDWEDLRQRLHTLVRSSDASARAAIADALGLAPSTLKNIISSAVPGAQIRGRVAAWLAEQSAPATPQKGLRHVTISAPQDEPEPAAPNGAAHRLSASQRERLDFLLQHLPPGEIRRDAGLTLDVVRQAASGAEFTPEIISRLVEFLSR